MQLPVWTNYICYCRVCMCYPSGAANLQRNEQSTWSIPFKSLKTSPKQSSVEGAFVVKSLTEVHLRSCPIGSPHYTCLLEQAQVCEPYSEIWAKMVHHVVARPLPLTGSQTLYWHHHMIGHLSCFLSRTRSIEHQCVGLFCFKSTNDSCCVSLFRSANTEKNLCV